MRYPEYEELLSDARPGTATDHRTLQQESLFEDSTLEALLIESQRQERERIETELEQIESQLQDRTEIYDGAVSELETSIREEEERLQRLQRPSIPDDRVVSQKRKVRDLERELQEVQRTHWRDREQLERERRQLRRELAEVIDTNLSVFF